MVVRKLMGTSLRKEIEHGLRGKTTMSSQRSLEKARRGWSSLDRRGSGGVDRRMQSGTEADGDGSRVLRLDPVLAVGVEEDAVLLDSLERRGGASGRDDGDVPATSPLGRMRQRGRLRE